MHVTACANDLNTQQFDVLASSSRLKFNRADSAFARKRSVYRAGQTIWGAIKVDNELESPLPISSQPYQFAGVKYPNAFTAP
jgi:hypothetical protein